MITLVNCAAPQPSEGAGIPPPGLLSLAAAVREAGFPVRWADLAPTGAAGPPAPKDLARWLGEVTPLVGFSAMSNMLPYALEAARHLKAASPETTILLGGCGAQTAVHDILEQFPFIDFVFQGEAEVTLPEFLRRRTEGTDWSGVAGLAYRSRDRIVVNPPPPRLENLDALPLPAYDLVDLAGYDHYVGLLTSRGCPFSCAYCEGSLYRRKFLATRSISHVFEEIRLLQNNHRLPRLGVVDDTFTVRPARVVEFCRRYREGGWDFQWGALARVDGIDAGLMEQMAATRCEALYFGVEAGSDRMLQAIRKGVTRAQVCENVPRATEYFSEVIASFMWGFPFEELADLEETLLLAAYLRTFGIQVQLHLWSPMPRSQLFEQYRSQLVYDPQVQSNIVLGDVADYHALITSNSTIFAPFYHVPHPAFEQKKRMIEAMGFAG